MKTITFLFISLISFTTFSQEWKWLENSPVTYGKQDDVFFINENLGWSVNGQGNIFKTTDGGKTWNNVLKQPGTYFRCIAFVDSLHGFAGNIGTDYYPGVKDTIPLYETFDGGTSWKAMTTFSGPFPKGICNLNILDKDHIYGSGRVGGPCFFIKTEDGGKTWSSQNLNDKLGMLIDVNFHSVKEGFLFGGNSASTESERSVILATTDGGKTWQQRFISKDTMEMCWKVSFPSAKVGYVSVLGYDAHSTFIKTIDGGKTWNEYKLIEYGYETKGIGFINDNVGWVGGERGTLPVMKTLDGGKTWKPDYSLGPYVNRFRFINGKVGYAIGSTIYKIDLKAEGKK